MKTILVTGGSGFIGSNIVKNLIAKNFSIKVFDNNSRGTFKNLSAISKNITFIEGDIRDREKVISISKNVDSIIHLAYINGTENFYRKPYEVLDIAVKGMINIIDCMSINNINELILASSSEVYQQPSIVPTDEKIPLYIPDIFNPRISYGGGKIISELLSINFARSTNKKLIIFRPHNVYGPNMGNDHVIPQFINSIIPQLKNSEIKLEIQGSGDETRSFIYIDDFIESFNIIFTNGNDQNIYNLGTQDEISIKNLVNLISKVINKKIDIIHKEINLGSATRRCPDISKIKSLGFKPKINLEVGVNKTFNWYFKEYEKKI